MTGCTNDSLVNVKRRLREKRKGGISVSSSSIARIIVFSCLFLLTAPRFSLAEPSAEPETQNEKESYSIGYQVGASIKTDGVEIEFERLVQGLQDAIDDKEPRLGMEEMRALIVDLRKRSRELQARKFQEKVVANAEESEKFLAQNKTQPGIRTTESGLQYKVVEEGEGESPGPKDFVKVNYRGAFIDGTEFDSSYAKGEPIRVQVDRVIKGWTEALAMMKPGAEWQVFVPPDLGYGRRGQGQNIPPNKVLVFDMELVDVEKEAAAAPADQQPASRQLAQAPFREKDRPSPAKSPNRGTAMSSAAGGAMRPVRSTPFSIRTLMCWTSWSPAKKPSPSRPGSFPGTT